MSSIIKSARGQTIDMEALVARNPNTVAVTGGGIAMNARGDFIGPGGKVIKTREEIDMAYNKDNPNATQTAKPVSIKKTSMMADYNEEQEPKNSRSKKENDIIDEDNLEVTTLSSEDSSNNTEDAKSKSSNSEKKETTTESSTDSTKKRRVTTNKE